MELWPLALFRSQKDQWCPVEVQKKRQIMDHLTWWMVFNIHNAISWRGGSLLLHLSDISYDLWKWAIYTDVGCKIARRFCQVIGWDYSCATISNPWWMAGCFPILFSLSKCYPNHCLKCSFGWVTFELGMGHIRLTSIRRVISLNDVSCLYVHHCWSWLTC